MVQSMCLSLCLWTVATSCRSVGPCPAPVTLTRTAPMAAPRVVSDSSVWVFRQPCTFDREAVKLVIPLPRVSTSLTLVRTPGDSRDDFYSKTSSCKRPWNAARVPEEPPGERLVSHGLHVAP